MSRLYSTTALASLTLHLAVLSMFSVSASDTSCGSSGADGCSCQPFTCSIQSPQSATCVSTNNDCTSVGCYETGGPNGSFEVAEGANATICTTTGPLVGAGCSNGVSTYCKTIRTCTCDPFGHCVSPATESGFFVPCTSNP